MVVVLVVSTVDELVVLKVVSLVAWSVEEWVA